MKKCLALLLTLVCLVTLVACDTDNPSGDTVKHVPDEPVQIAGVIVEVHDGNYLIECEAGDGYQCGIADGTQISVSRNVERDPNCSVGDRILVKFNGEFQETYPLGINSPIEIGKLELRLTNDLGNSIE